ncbi:hypothetical protein GHK92_06445 [Nocardioides sp. dk4132]|uniref:alpha/beta hydrolase n=1 Tax=unclassified Nocardioides TaxID=2615069 RepID=UPI001296876C|nr:MULTISPECIES: alpha/beta hydrolase [unclassified Nocardioides]MQW75506.1 hypothetical protein [Nocardioides sp. dk4132]QGA08421.1 hypothetical protein GFH29_14190 [Nocardioides sp. dk884]
MSPRLLCALALVLGLGVSAPAATAAPTAAPDPRPGTTRVVSRPVVFELDHGTSAVGCSADGRLHQVRGRLVGPRDAVLGRAGTVRLNVLVHGVATAGWAWHLRERPAHDYATRLGRHGELSLVLDRLGYGASPLENGAATCLSAQSSMLHQVVQHVRSGNYSFVRGEGSPSRAASVVLHGHGTGAMLAQLEAGNHDDVDGLVLMSFGAATTSPARRELGRLVGACLHEDRVGVGTTAAEYRSLLLASAAPGVRKAALRRRAEAPCGEVTSIARGRVQAALAGHSVDAPVLLMRGSRDALVSGAAVRSQSAAYPRGVEVTTRTVHGAGSLLPLERQAPQVRRTVLRWLRAL